MKPCRGLLISAIALVSFTACTDRDDGDSVTASKGDAAVEDASHDVTPAPGPQLDAGRDAASDAGSACPAGSTLQRTRTTCPGAPLTAPAALLSALGSAAPGDVVSLADLPESAAPCLPVVVCTPADAPTLLFSDSPESPGQDGVLYADTVNAGRYRLYVYHANGSAAARKFPVVVLNPGAQTAKVTIVRRGLAAPSTAYVSVGKEVLVDWLADRPAISLLVPPQQRLLLDEALDQLHAGPNELVHAIYDVVVDRTVKISFVSVLANADAAAATAGLPLLARDVNHQRGTFPSADVLVALARDVPGGALKKGVQRLRLGQGEVDETLVGVDSTTGAKQTLLGNYGMRYRFALGLPASARAALSRRAAVVGAASRSAASPTISSS